MHSGRSEVQNSAQSDMSSTEFTSAQTAASPSLPHSHLHKENSDVHNLLSIAMGAMNPAKRIKFSNDLLAFLTESCEKYREVVPDEFKD